MNKQFLNGKYLLVICGLLLMSACAGTGGTKNNIENRAQDRWDSILSDDLIGSYEYLSPGYRSSVSLNRYQRTLLMQKIRWTGAEFIKSDCAETSCKVKISLDYTVYGAIPGVKSFDGAQEIEESWVKVDGNWYFVPNR